MLDKIKILLFRSYRNRISPLDVDVDLIEGAAEERMIIIDPASRMLTFDDRYMKISQHINILKDDLRNIKQSSTAKEERDNIKGYIRVNYKKLLDDIKDLFINGNDSSIDRLYKEHDVAVWRHKVKYPKAVVMKVEGIMLPI